MTRFDVTCAATMLGLALACGGGPVATRSDRVPAAAAPSAAPKVTPVAPSAAPVATPAPSAIAVVIEVATTCVGTPVGASFSPLKKYGESPKGSGCYLPSAGDGGVEGKVPLDLDDLTSGCGERGWYSDLVRRSQQPEKLYVRVTGALEVVIRARSMLGKREDGEYNEMGWGDWRVLHDGAAGAGGIVEVPFEDAPRDLDHKFELSVEAGGSSKSYVFYWAVSC